MIAASEDESRAHFQTDSSGGSFGFCPGRCEKEALPNENGFPLRLPFPGPIALFDRDNFGTGELDRAHACFGFIAEVDAETERSIVFFLLGPALVSVSSEAREGGFGG